MRGAALLGAFVFVGCQTSPPPSTTTSTSTSTSTSTPTSTSTSTPTPTPTAKYVPKGFIESAHVTASSRDRTYSLFVPDSYDAQKTYPLVVMLHGDGGQGRDIRTRFALEEQAREDAIFVYPDGDNRTWRQAVEPHANDDLFMFDVIVAKTIDTYHLDPKRVFVTGFSSGAYMTNQLACWRGDAIRAIAPMSGGGPYDATGKTYDAQGHLVCKGKAPAVMIVHGDADNVVPFNEAQKSLAHWTFANRSGPFPKESDACVTAPNEGPPGEPVTFCKIAGAGHTVWKDAPARVWKFFSGFR